MSRLRHDPVGVSRDVMSGFLRTDGTGVAAEAAYQLVFALPALAMFLVSLSGLTVQYTEVDLFQLLLDRTEDTMPSEAFQILSLVSDRVKEQSGFGVLFIGLVIALWSATNAVAALIKGINRAHGMQGSRGMVAQQLLALRLSICLSLLMSMAFVLSLFGQQIGERLSGALGYGGAFSVLFGVARIPIVLLLFMGALAILYGLGPERRMPLRTTYPGAFIATLFWILATWGFGLYLSITDPGSAYGVLGGILALLVFLYISCIVVIIGAETNAALLRRRSGRKLHS